MTHIEEIAVKGIKCAAAICIKRTIYICLLAADTRMVVSLLTRILNEQDIVKQGQKAISHHNALLIISCNLLQDLPLGVVCRKDASVLEVCALRLLGIVSEDTPENPVTCQRCGPFALIHIKAVRCKFFSRIWKCRIEISEKPVNSIYRNFPDTEKSKNMIDTECIEVLRHLCQTGLPPGVTVLGHLLPIICRESPVLSEIREGIRWCSSLRIHMEQLRMHPGVNTCAAYADRKVTFEYHAIFVGISAHLRQLGIKMILNETPEVHLLLVIGAEGLDHRSVIFGICLPLSEIRRTVHITKHAESRIREEPAAVLRNEFLI